MTKVRFDEITENDFHFIQRVYNYYVLNSTTTFHTEELNLEEIKAALPYNHKLYSCYVIL